MKSFKKLFMLCIFAFSLFANVAQAQQWCSGKLSYLLTDLAGGVIVYHSARGDFLQICNINSVWKGVSPATCATWAGYVRSAVVRKADVIFFYSEPTACNALPSYGSTPAPGYVMLNN